MKAGYAVAKELQRKKGGNASNRGIVVGMKLSQGCGNCYGA